MKARYFNSVVTRFHEAWAANVLCMLVNPNAGPDLLSHDRARGVELKFNLASDSTSNSEKYPRAWTVMDHQIAYAQTRECYWGLGRYKLSIPISQIPEQRRNNLEDFVIHRDIYLVEWSWMNQFESHVTKGESEVSGEWKNTFRYPKYRSLPLVQKSCDVHKGTVHITQSVPDCFEINNACVPF